jgi:hypothetical protein
VYQAGARKDLIGDHEDIAQSALDASSSYEEYLQAIGATTEQIDNLAGVTGGYGIHLAEALNGVVVLTEAEWEKERALLAGADAAATSDEHMLRMAETYKTLAEQTEDPIEIQLRTEAALAELDNLKNRLETDLSQAYDVLVTAQVRWKESVADDLVGGLEDAGLAGDEMIARLEAIDQIFGTQTASEYRYNVAYDLEMPELLQALLDNPDQFIEDAQAFVDYFMPLETSVASAQEKVTELQADLDELAREYDAIINVTQVGNIPELKDQSATYTITTQVQGNMTPGYSYFGNYINDAAGGIVAQKNLIPAAAGYWVGEAGPEPFFPEQNGRIISNTEATRALREGGGSRGNGPIVVNINTPFNFADAAWVERELSPYIRRELREALRE